MLDRFNLLVLDLLSRAQQPLRREEGQGSVEYVLILVGVVAAAGVITVALKGKFGDLVNGVNL